LVVINNAGENNYLYMSVDPTNEHWIGLTDDNSVSVEGTFLWVDGTSPSSYGTPPYDPVGPANNAIRDFYSLKQTTGLWVLNPNVNRRAICESAPVCGNGAISSGETCDDGNTANGDGCSSVCQIEAVVCGNSLVQVGETCDDGNTVSNDGCSAACAVEAGFTCVGQPSVCNASCTAGTWHSQMGSTTTEYFYCTSPTQSWSAQRNACTQKGASWNLVTIDNVTENNFIQSFITTNEWIGFNDINLDNTYVWANGSSVSYTNWTVANPNGGDGSDCVIMLKANGQWDDQLCAGGRAAICEGPPICGNGVGALPENCDDGDNFSGDGCSSSCTVEGGWECTVPAGDGSLPSLCSTPSYAAIDRVTLESNPQGSHIRFKTSAEAGTVGFIISKESGGIFAPVHAGLITASPFGASGAEYTVPATRAGGYRIEEVDSSGVQREVWRGQLAVSATSNATSTHQTVDGSRFSAPATGQLTAMHTRNVRVSSARLLQRMAGAVVQTAAAGLQRVPAGALAKSIGVTTTAVRHALNNGSLALYDQGQSVPWSSVDGGQALAFFSEANANQYSAVRSYVVKLGHTGQKLLWQEGVSSTQVGFGTVEKSVETNRFPALAAGPDPETDFWFWAPLVAGSAEFGVFETSFDLQGTPTGESATLTLRIAGAWGLQDSQVQKVNVEVNGQQVGELQLTTLGTQTWMLSVPARLLTAQGNRLRLTATSATAAGVVGAYVDGFVVRYAQELRASNGELVFEALTEGPAAVELAGRRAWVLDVSARTAVLPKLSIGQGRVRASWVQQKGHRYAVASDKGWLTPTLRGLHSNTSIAALQGADYVVVTDEKFWDAAQHLAGLRRASGLSSHVVNVDALYDNFAHAQRTPHAIRDFITAARPRYVLFLGDGSVDYRGDETSGSGFIPPKVLRSESGLYASDTWFASESLDHKTAIGRLPVQTLDEAWRVVSRIETYESDPNAAWTHDALLIAGVNRINHFTQLNTYLSNKLPQGLDTLTLDVNNGGIDLARQNTLKALNEGAYWFNYQGHGAMDRLDDEGLLSAQTLASLTNKRSLPMVTALTCTVSRFEVPAVRTWSESMLVSSDEGGAIAVWGPTGLSMPNRTVFMAESFAKHLFAAQENGGRLGDVLTALYRDAGSASYADEHLKFFVLLGDPALRVRKPGSEGATVSNRSADRSPSGDLPIGCAAGNTSRMPTLWMLALVASWVFRRRVTMRRSLSSGDT